MTSLNDKATAVTAVRTLQHLFHNAGTFLPPVVFTMNAPCPLWRVNADSLVRVRVFKCLAANLTFRSNENEVTQGLRTAIRACGARCAASTLLANFSGDWRQAMLAIAWSDMGCRAQKDVSLLDAFDVTRLLMRTVHSLPHVSMELMADACTQLPLVSSLLHTNYVSQSGDADMCDIAAAAGAWSTADELLARYTSPLLRDEAHAHLVLALGACKTAAARIASAKPFLDMPSDAARSLVFARRKRLHEFANERDQAWTATVRVVAPLMRADEELGMPLRPSIFTVSFYDSRPFVTTDT